MLGLARTAPNRVSLLKHLPLAKRSFAEVVNHTHSNEASASTLPPAIRRRHAIKKPASALINSTTKGKIVLKEDHGLYAFFRKKESDDLVGDARFEVVETPENMQKDTGRAWKASELRLKSFRDLHALWYILLRERNLLASQKEEARRMGVTNTESQVSLNRVHNCRKSMARIKAVLNERRLAYEGAVRLVEKKREEKEDLEVQEHLKETWKKDRKQAKERLYLERRRALQLQRKRGVEEKVNDVSTPAEPAPTLVELTPDISTHPEAEEQHGALETEPIEVFSVEETPAKNPKVVTENAGDKLEAKETEKETETVPNANTPRQTATNTAVAGLFGDSPKSERRN